MTMRIVIKLGGETIDGPDLGTLARDIRGLVDAGHRIVLTHGAGPQTTTLCKRLGLDPHIIAGRRVTDGLTLDVLKMVLGRLNVDLCAALRAAGVAALGLHGAAVAVHRPPRVLSGAGSEPVDLGLVGDVTAIDHELLDWAASAGRVPVLACLGSSADGTVYNINADIVASRLAGDLQADALMLVTNTNGVRRDAADPASRIPELTVTEGQRLIADGQVQGGMIPKLEESFAALDRGVRAVLIVAGDLLRAIAEPGQSGTRIVP